MRKIIPGAIVQVYAMSFSLRLITPGLSNVHCFQRDHFGVLTGLPAFIENVHSFDFERGKKFF